jgi:myo-inositol-1(or 4)-monophosphatase
MLNGEPLKIGTPPPLERALVATGFSYVSAERELQAALFARVLPRARDVRRAGSAALDLAWVAAGRLDVFYEHGLAEWDHAAGDVLVREAGGVVVPLPAAGGLRAGILAGPEALAEALLPLVQG